MRLNAQDSPTAAQYEHRSRERTGAPGVAATIRRRGRLARLVGTVTDYNRFGIGVILDQPLPKDATVYLTIASTTVSIDHVVGVVHNCIAQDVGYRCGIQFRTTSTLQVDQCQIEENLATLERALQEPG